MNYFLKLSLFLVVTFTFVACSNDDESGTPISAETANMVIRMVDAPGDYDEVNVDVEEIEVRYNDGETVVLGEENAGIYNLLELTGGASALLVDDDVPAGTITQIRLILGDENTIVVDGESFPLSTPSAQQSGLKLNLNEELLEGVLYEFVLDFDVERSIVVQGNGNYQLKPVINLSLNSEIGEIVGEVQPVDVQTLVTAVNGDIEISAYTDINGDYHLYGLPAGFYDLTFEPDPSSGYDPIVVTDVEVVVGMITTVDPVIFD